MAYKFIGGALPYSLLKVWRSVWIRGRFGGGKTSLAMAWAKMLKDSGFVRYIISNTPCVWADNFVIRSRDDMQMVGYKHLQPRITKDEYTLDVAVVLDEAGLFLRMGKKADEFSAFLRKMNVVLIMPSVRSVHASLRSFQVTRLLNLSKFGLPAWMYKYRLTDGGERDEEKFLWVRPGQVFGYYDTYAFPVDDLGISEFLLYHVEIAEHLYYERIKATRKPVEETYNPLADVVSEFGDAADIFTIAAQETGRNSRKRRR